MSEREVPLLRAVEYACDVPVLSLPAARVRGYCAFCGYHDYPTLADVPPACPLCGGAWRAVRGRR